ncbi:MAG: VOC family protein [Oscillospiraceae bacterium]
MKIIGFNHFQLDSTDVDRTRAFYEQALGGKVTRVMERPNGWKGYHVSLAEGAVIEIQPPRLPETCGGFKGWDHVALTVDSCAAACESVVAAGGHIEKKPSPNMMGSIQIINAVAIGLDGEKLELIELV